MLAEPELIVKLNKEKNHLLNVSAYVIILICCEEQEKVTKLDILHLESALLFFIQVTPHVIWWNYFPSSLSIFDRSKDLNTIKHTCSASRLEEFSGYSSSTNSFPQFIFKAF